MNQFNYARIMARLVNVPLLLHPRTAMALYNALAGRFGTMPGELPITPDAKLVDRRLEMLVASPRPKGSRFAGEQPVSESGTGIEPYRLHQGVAIVPVLGELVNRGAWVGSHSGMTSYEGLKFQLARVAGDSRARSVILDMDTPGGEALGFDTAASSVRSLNAQKPVYAVVNGMAASAGYALASGAKRIITTSTGVSGSIGVVMLHLDQSRAIEAEGITPTLIYAGAHKVDANPLEPLTDSVREQLQGEVQTYYDAFINIVAEGRNGKTSARAARETEARTYIGREAVDAKLADDVGSFEDVLAELSRKNVRKSARSQTMNARLTDAADAVVELEFGGQKFADMTTLLEHAAKLSEQGAAAQIARITAILADERSKGRERATLKIACKAPDMSVEDVLDLAADTVQQVHGIAERTEATNANKVTGQPGDEAKRTEPEAKDPNSGWGKIIAEKNERTKRQMGRAVLSR